MWWLILLIVLGISFFISVALEDSDVGCWIFFIASIILLFLGVASIVSKEVVDEYEQVQYEIQGLENNIITSQDTTGRFILGFGSINSTTTEKIKYYYFKVDGIGKQLETINVNNFSNTYIRETDDIKPCLIHRYQVTKNTGFFKWLFGESEKEALIAEVLVVPTNTIKIEYNVEVN